MRRKNLLSLVGISGALAVSSGCAWQERHVPREIPEPPRELTAYERRFNALLYEKFFKPLLEDYFNQIDAMGQGMAGTD